MNSKQSRFYRRVFRQCLSRYDDIRSIEGTNSCAAFYNGLAQEGGSAGYNSRVVRVLPSDFVCDVELAARRVLVGGEHFYFKSVYLNKDEKFDIEFKTTVSEKAYMSMKHTVQEKLGKELARVRIYPVSQYLRSVDLR